MFQIVVSLLSLCLHLAVMVTCMWRSRLRATFLLNRDEVKAEDKASIPYKTGYDIYKLLGIVIYLLLWLILNPFFVSVILEIKPTEIKLFKNCLFKELSVNIAFLS